DHVHGGHGPVGGPLRLVDHVPGPQDGARGHAGGGTVGAGAIGGGADGPGGGGGGTHGGTVVLGGGGGGPAGRAALVTVRAITSAAAELPGPREARDR